MSCDPEKVTAFVDGELDGASLAEVAAHVDACPACRAQAEAERELRARLGRLPVPELPAGLEARLRSRVRRRPVAATAARWALPVAATIVLGFWLRGHAPFVAWDLARDHDKCFSRHPLPAKVWSGDPAVVTGWFEAKGTAVPALPAEVGALRLQGARYCPLASLALAPHVYYAAEDRHVSVFVLPQDVRIGLRFAGEARGDAVRLLRVEGELVGIVGGRDADVQAVESALRPVMAVLQAKSESTGIAVGPNGSPLIP